MAYSKWFVNPTNRLLKLSLITENIESFTKTLDAFCNQTVSMTSRTCSSQNLMYYCNSKLSSNSIGLFSCEGYVVNDCATSDASCQTAGLVDSAMKDCMQAAMNNFSLESNMSCRTNEEPMHTWLIFSLVAAVPLAIFGIFALKNFCKQYQKNKEAEKAKEEVPEKPIQITVD